MSAEKRDVDKFMHTHPRFVNESVYAYTVRFARAFADAERKAERERCAKICIDEASAWAKSVAEGSEQHAYETVVLRNAAEAIERTPNE